MKKIVVSWLCALLIFSSAFFVGFQVNDGAEGKSISGNTVTYTPHAPIRIDSDADFAAVASSGDGGPLTPWMIEGWDINGTGFGYCIYIGNTTDYFSVRDCYLYKSQGYWNYPFYQHTGVYLYNTSNGNISDNIIPDHSKCIKLENSHNNLINNNTVNITTWAGIELDYSENNTIDGNYVHNCTSSDLGGIGVGYSPNTTIVDNNVLNNSRGITLYASEYSRIENNNLVNNSIMLGGGSLEHWNTQIIDAANTVNGKPVYYVKNQTSGTIPPGAGEVILANCTNVLVENQIFYDVALGIEVGYSDNNIITNNTITAPVTFGYAGIYLSYSEYNNINRNTVSDFYSEQGGIFADDCNNNQFSYNEAYDNYYGIYVQDSNNDTIDNNTVNGSIGINIRVYRSPDSIVDNNEASYSQDQGISFDFQSPRGVCKNNYVHNNSVHGITMGASNYLITGNTMASNNLTGLILEYSSHNCTIYHNNFIDNGGGASQASDYGVDNTWDNGYPSGGNYWSDYAPDNTTAIIETNFGNITFMMYPDLVPITTNNFIDYVSADFYTDSLFHRVIDNFMIQGGGYYRDGGVLTEKAALYPPIPLEISPILRHTDGAVAMARGALPDSATSQFYICDGPQPFLDDSYAVFGHVVDGMDVVRSIAALPTHVEGIHTDVPDTDVIIISITIFNKTTMDQYNGPLQNVLGPDGIGDTSYGIMSTGTFEVQDERPYTMTGLEIPPFSFMLANGNITNYTLYLDTGGPLTKLTPFVDYQLLWWIGQVDYWNPPVAGGEFVAYYNYTGPVTTDVFDNYPLMNPTINGRVQRFPIRIDSNADFDAEHGVVNWATGVGSQGNPWIIENYDIDGVGNGFCIYIGNTTEYYMVNNCHLHNARDVYSPDFYNNAGLTLYNTTNGTVIDNVISDSYHGITSYYSHEIDIVNNSILSNNQYGIFLRHSNWNSISNCIVNDSFIGIYLSSSNEENKTANNTISNCDVTNNQMGFCFQDYSWLNVITNTNISNNNAGIQMMRVHNSSSNPRFNSINYCNITHNANMDIYLSYSFNNNISHNNISHSDYGIHLSMSDNTTITDNEFFNVSSPIYSSASSFMIVHNNTMDDSGGIWIFGWLEHWNTHRIEASNEIDGKPVYYLKNQTGGTAPLGAGEVILGNCTGVVVADEDDGIRYILAGYSTNCDIIDNQFPSSKQCEIFTMVCEDLIIRNNTVSKGSILCYAGTGSRIDNNTFSQSVRDGADAGVMLYGVTDHIVENNNISNNGEYGLYIEGGNNNTVMNNTIADNQGSGIYVYQTSWNSFYDNTIENNSYAGIEIKETSHNNTIYHNNFIDNTPQQALDYGVNNTWDNGYPSGGNYWSDYTGVDLNSTPTQDVPPPDGIGDVPYQITSEVEVIWEHVFGPCLGGETGPLYLDNGNIINQFHLYLDGPPVIKLKEGIDYFLSRTTGEIDTTPIEPFAAGWTFYANYTYLGKSPAGAKDNYPLMEPVNQEPQLTPHLPIRIDSNSDFDEAHGVVNWATGDGSQCNPWVIRDWDINGTGYGYCIYVGNTTDHFIIRDCVLHEANGIDSMPLFPDAGLTLNNVQNASVEDNNASNCNRGFFFDTTFFSTIEENIVSSNAYEGIFIRYSDSNNITGNDVFSNELDGFYLFDVENNKIRTNNITYNKREGIWFFLSNMCTISGNLITNNVQGGINLALSEDNTIINNTISGHIRGIDLGSSSINNHIYHNNFINNIDQAEDDDTNFWHNGYPSGGNYWSDYAGADNFYGPDQNILGSDGIGDTNYTNIGGTGAVDEYPLMAPFEYTEFDISLQSGWNLVSLPVRQLNWSIDSVLESIAGSWECIQTFDAETDTWLSNNLPRPDVLDDLHEMNHFRAYWINVTQPGQTLTVKGDKFGSNLSLPLTAGWNLVGYPSLVPNRVIDALVGTGYDREVETFDSGAPYRISQIGNQDLMAPGEGYWVHVPADTTWVADWHDVTPAGSWMFIGAFSPTSGRMQFGAFTSSVRPTDVVVYITINGSIDGGYLTIPDDLGPQPQTMTWTDGPPGATAEFFDYNPPGRQITAGDYIDLFGLQPGTTYSFEFLFLPTNEYITMIGAPSQITTP